MLDLLVQIVDKNHNYQNNNNCIKGREQSAIDRVQNVKESLVEDNIEINKVLLAYVIGLLESYLCLCSSV